MGRPKKYRQPSEEDGGNAPLVIPAPTDYTPIGEPVREISESVIESVSLLVANGCAVNVAAQALGINHNTAKGWGQIGREHESLGIESIYTKWNHCIAVAKSQIEKNLVQAIISHGSTDWKALAFVIERKFPARWGTKQMEKALASETADTAGMSTADLVKMLTGGGTSDSTSPGVLTVSNTATTVEDE